MTIVLAKHRRVVLHFVDALSNIHIHMIRWIYPSVMATRSISRRSNAPGRFQWRSPSASLFTSQGRPVSAVPEAHRATTFHQLHRRLFCKVIFAALFQGNPPVLNAERKMSENCVHDTAFCCASVGYGPYQNITNLGVLIPSVLDAVRRVWLNKVSGASPWCLANQRQKC